MAIRPIYIAKESNNSYIKEIEVEFQWFPGFSINQKQKSIESLHNSFIKRKNNVEEIRILEISSKSTNPFGVKLSAFNLMIEIKELKFSVECAFQASKIFENGGPYTEILKMNSREAKKYEKLKNSGNLKGFEFFSIKWETEPTTLFYDWLYINAVYANKELSKELIKYNSFTDIEFNPKKSLNSQCKSAALYVSLYKNGSLKIIFNEKEKLRRIKKYKEIISKYKNIKFLRVQKKLEIKNPLN